jgi:hypothetical protein
MLQPAKTETFQIFYDKGFGFNETDSCSAVIKPTKDTQLENVCSINFRLPTSKISGLRIDPGNGSNNIWKLKSIRLKYLQANKILYSHVWMTQDIMNDFQPIHSLEPFIVHNGVICLTVSSSDPYFFYKRNFNDVAVVFRKNILFIRFFLISLLLIILFCINSLAFKNAFRNPVKHIIKFFSSLPESKFIFPLSFWIVLSIIAMIKLWLVGSQTIAAFPSPHDDELFVRMARHIAAGQWLGEYTNLTLLKEPFYSIWIAIMFWIGIPLTFSQQLLYIFTCLVTIIAIRPLFKTIVPIYLLIYVTLIFHPISYPINIMTRVIREGLYISLPLLVIAFFIGLILRIKASFKELIPWSICLGISLVIFWLTREEGIWIIPALMILCFYFIILSISTCRYRAKSILSLLIVLCVFLMSIIIVAGLNKIYYGVFTMSEQLQPDFVNALNSLKRVKSKSSKQYLSVPREKRENIYVVSPSFRELRPYLEGDLGKAWSMYGAYAKNDISNSHFQFAFRDAVAAAGYYSSGESAVLYYQRLTKEVNCACDSKLLSCENKNNSLFMNVSYSETLHINDIKLLARTFIKTAISAVSLEGVSILPIIHQTHGSKEIISLFKDITRSRIIKAEDDTSEDLRCQQQVDNFKLTILNSFIIFYRFYIPLFTIFGLLCYTYQTILIVLRREINVIVVVMTALLITIISRIFLVSLMDFTIDPTFASQKIYQLAMHPLIVLFALFAFAQKQDS